MSSTERAALLDQARAQGADAVKKWEKLYRAAPLIAPINGTVIVRKMEPGQTVSQADPILVLADELMVLVQMDETDIGRISLGQRVSIDLDAYPGKSVPGRVTHIAFEAETVNNVTVYAVEVTPERVPDFFRSGMTAFVRFRVSTVSDVVAVPENAVQHRRRGAVVLVQDQKAGTANAVPVQVGLSDGKYVEIKSGIAAGQLVVVPKFQAKERGERRGGGSPFTPQMGGGGRR
ncbi:efflux RND transporter periplasmic adaptor subunit [bacterium]|nr:efflux RND transporter periplasmic adaptor subunit [bacterium]